MKVVFMGTPDFAVPVLQTLIDSNDHQVTAVITQPDKPRGRSGKLSFTPVKEVAIEHDIPVYTPKKVKDPEFVEVLKTLECDVIVVVAFGQLLSKEILDYPKYGCINVHASLLPRWRGAAPIQWSILEGDQKTGVTIMQLDEGLDTGDMLLTKEFDIAVDETGESLFDKLSLLGGPLVLDVLSQAENGTLNPVKQDTTKSTYAKMLTKELGNLDFSQDAVKLERYVRGLNSWPSAYTTFRGKKLKIWKAAVMDEDSDLTCGTITAIDKDGFTIQTGKGQLKLLEIQLEGKKRMSAADFLRGVKVEIGEKIEG